jgi:transcriptional regulator with XRE-family HTH domain
MARRYPHASSLAIELERARLDRGLTYEQLGALAEVDTGQVWRICKGEFATLNPGVLRICSALGVQPNDGGGNRGVSPLGVEATLAAEAVAAWDRTDTGAKLIMRVLRALRPP